MSKHNYLWTSLRARLQLISTTAGANYNWLFLPGGPGLGSESLAPLTQLLKLPGRIWHLDLPGDGSNLTENDSESFSRWSEALQEAVDALDNVILVAHSTGGMYALATKGLESSLTGLVLMDSAPNASWQMHFMRYVKQHPIPEIENLQKIYAENPSNELLKKLTILYSPYLFTEEGLKKDRSFLESLAYNYKTCDWSARYFDESYKAKWIPKNIPTLIFAGENDVLTPISLFMESKEFQNPRISIKTIKNAAHFPWIENPNEVVSVFTDYFHHLSRA